ncbi:MAG: RNA polymerase sigma factor [Emcibacter sp.]|nr:RNA polymerase sigma factor [Emcibacter sp.]
MAKIYNIKRDDEVNRLYLDVKGGLKRFLLQRLKNEQDAEDVLQECFIKFRAYKPEENIANPEGLLFKIAYTLSIDAIRKKKSDLARESSWVKENITYLSGEPIMEMPHTDRTLDSRRRIKGILSLLKELSPKCRHVFMLHKFEGLSHRQVAAHVGISKSMVEKYMIKALKKINHIRYDKI